MASAAVSQIEKRLIDQLRLAVDYYDLDLDEQESLLADVTETLADLEELGHEAQAALHIASLLFVAFFDDVDEFTDVSEAALETIVQIAPQADAETLRQIQAENTRSDGIRALETWGQAAIPLLMVLYLYLQDDDVSVRRSARALAEKLAGDDKALLAEPVIGLADFLLVHEVEDDWEIRQRMANTLGEFVDADPRALQILVHVAATDSDEDVRNAAMEAADRIAESDEQTKQVLLDLLNQDLRQADAAAILTVWSARFPDLISESPVKSRELLLQLALKSEPAVTVRAEEELRKVLSDEDTDLVAAYIEAAEQFLDPHETGEWEIRQAMAIKLGDLKRLDAAQLETVRDLLLTSASDAEREDDPDVRLSAASAFGKLVSDADSLKRFVKVSLLFDADDLDTELEKKATDVYGKASAKERLREIYVELSTQHRDKIRDYAAGRIAGTLVDLIDQEDLQLGDFSLEEQNSVRMLLARQVLEGAVTEPEIGLDTLWDDSPEAIRQKASMYIRLAGDYLVYTDRGDADSADEEVFEDEDPFEYDPFEESGYDDFFYDAAEHWQIRRRAARALGNLTNLDSAQTSSVLDLLAQASSERLEGDSDVRQSALEAMGSIAACLKENIDSAERAVAHLLAVSRNDDEDETLRLSAESVIARILKELKFSDVVNWATGHAENKVRYEAQRSIVRSGIAAGQIDAATRLLDELKARNPVIGIPGQTSSYAAIGQSRRAAQVAILVRMIDELATSRSALLDEAGAQFEQGGEVDRIGKHEWTVDALMEISAASDTWAGDWDRAVLGANMVMVSQALSRAWERQESDDGRSFLLDSVLAALDVVESHAAVTAYHDTRESDIRQNAVLWLGRQERRLYRFDKTRHAAVSEELRSRASQTQSDGDGQEELRNTVNIVSQMFRRTIEATEETKLRSAVKTRGAAAEGIELDAAIRGLVEKSDWKSLRPLVKAWARWIVLDDKFWGIADAEEEMRREPKAVLPLIEQLRRPLQLADVEMNRRDIGGRSGENDGSPDAGLANRMAAENRTTFFELIAPSEYARLLEKVWLSDKNGEEGEPSLNVLDVDERQRLQRWLAAREWDDEQLTAVQKSKIERARLESGGMPEVELDDMSPWPRAMQFEELTDEDLHRIIELIALETLREREVIVHRHITGLLATMSHPWYLIRSGYQATPEETEKIAEMKTELRRHAVRYFASRLRTESNLDIRENMARTLANLSDTEYGQTAIDVLVQAVVGEERRQDRRQELLSDYYLKPSKQRSEEAARILKDAIDQAKQTLLTLRRLNQHLFYVGLAVFVVGFGVAMFSTALSTQALGVLAGVGGLIGVLRHMVKNPMDRIQNAMGNLVQMEAAFTSFMWELNLNQTFIQSRYVANGYLTQDEIQTTVDRVEGGIRAIMGLVETYTETSSPRIVTRIHKVSPVTADITKKGQDLTIHGRFLLGDSVEKKETAGTVAINHMPVDVRAKWTEDKVIFRLGEEELTTLSGDSNGRLPESVLVSLFVDGMETNALPVRLIRRNQGIPAAGHDQNGGGNASGGASGR